MMRTPDILLVNPLYIALDAVEERLMTPYFPLGLMYLASVLRDSNLDVALFDGAFDDNYERFEQVIVQTRPPVEASLPLSPRA